MIVTMKGISLDGRLIALAVRAGAAWLVCLGDSCTSVGNESIAVDTIRRHGAIRILKEFGGQKTVVV